MEAFGTVQLLLARNDHLPRKHGHPIPLPFSVTHQEDRLRMIRRFSGITPFPKRSGWVSSTHCGPGSPTSLNPTVVMCVEIHSFTHTNPSPSLPRHKLRPTLPESKPTLLPLRRPLPGQPLGFGELVRGHGLLQQERNFPSEDFPVKNRGDYR